MNHKLEVDGIQLSFGLNQILSDVYFKCETGKITGLLGRNGAGKTCLMNIIYGNLMALGKSVRFDNIPIFSAFKRPDLLVYLPQFNFIPKSLTLKRIFIDFNLKFPAFSNYFPEFKSKYKYAIRDLSGGQRRLVEVYVIIKMSAQFAMLDEPFSHIMPVQVEKIKGILNEEKQNKGIIITDHLYWHIVDCCDNLYVLSNGKTHLTKNIMDVETLGYARFYHKK